MKYNIERDMFLSLVVGLLFTLALLHVTWKLWTSWSFFVKPFPGTLPWIGSVLSIESQPHKILRQFQAYSRSNNGEALIWTAYQAGFASARVKFVENLLNSREIIKKASYYWTFKEWLCDGLLLSTGAKWKNRRRVITHSFHFAILQDFMDIFIKHATVFVEKLDSFADTDEALDIQEPTSLATLDVICETAMGVPLNAQSTQSEYVQATFNMTKYLEIRMKNPLYWPNFIFKRTYVGAQYYNCLKILHDFTMKVTNDRIQSRIQTQVKQNSDERQSSQNNYDDDKCSRKNKAFLDMLLDLYDKGEIDVEAIREEVDTFMFEGHDTTASALSWTLYLLGRNSRVQEKLYQEIDSVSKKEVRIMDKIREMNYLELVIKESLRLHPPVPIFGRSLEKDELIDGHEIPKGTDVSINVIGLHTDPEHWDSPDEFRPERFSDEKFLKRNPYTYVPFSAGPRNCIGQKFAMLEIKVLLYHIMSKFRLVSVQSEEEVHGSFEVIHRSNNGINIKIFSRS